MGHHTRVDVVIPVPADGPLTLAAYGTFPSPLPTGDSPRGVVSTADRVPLPNGKLYGVIAHQTGTGVDLTDVQISVYEDLDTVGGFLKVERRNVYQSAVLPGPLTLNGVDAFLNERFEPEPFRNGLWIHVDADYSAGLGDNVVVTLLLEIDP